MTVTEKVIPQLLGVDIGCGMTCVKLNRNSAEFQKLDKVIRKNVPSWDRTKRLCKRATTTYLKGVVDGMTTLPTKAWREEYSKLTDEQKTLNGRYLALKDEVREVEKIRKSVYDILRREEQEQQPRRTQDVGR